MADQVGRLKDQGHGMIHKMSEPSSNFRKILGFVTVLASGATLLMLGGLAIGGIIITLILATPVLIVASPILVPAGIFLFLVTAGFLGVGGTAIAALSVVSWLYHYAKGRHPPGSEQVDAAGRRIADTAHHMRDRAREYAGYMQTKAQEAAPGA